MKEMSVLHLDVMLREMFVCTLHYKYHPPLYLDAEELKSWVVKKVPTLRGKAFNIRLCP